MGSFVHLHGVSGGSISRSTQKEAFDIFLRKTDASFTVHILVLRTTGGFIAWTTVAPLLESSEWLCGRHCSTTLPHYQHNSRYIAHHVPLQLRSEPIDEFLVKPKGRPTSHTQVETSA